MNDNRLNEPTPEQVEAACKAHEFTNAFGPERETRMRAALEAAGAVPDAATEAQVEAAAKAMYELRAKIDDPFWGGGKLDYGIKQIYRQDARAALAAADAVVTEEMIADTLCSYQRHTGDRECEYDHETARAILALFRGGAK